MHDEHSDFITHFNPRLERLLSFSTSTSDTDTFSETVPSLLNSFVRQYPLRQITEPPVYVMGDKIGQKVYPPSAAPPPPQGPIGMSPQPMGMNQPGMGMVPQGMNPQTMGMSPQGIGMTQQAMLAQQNSNMESLERRRERERERVRERSGSIGAVRIRSRSTVLIKLSTWAFGSNGLVHPDWTTMTLQVGTRYCFGCWGSHRGLMS